MRTAVEDGAATHRGVAKPLGANRGFVLNMAEESGVRWKDVLVAPKDRSVCVSPTAEAGGASSKGATRELREALCIVKLTAAGNGACSPVVRKERKVVLLFVKRMVVENGVYTMEVEFALKAFTAALIFVSLMVAGKGVLLLDVRKAHVAGPIAV